MPDLPEFDYFITQFAGSLLRESGTGRSRWFGRLLRFYNGNEFVFKNFFGNDYTETEFRDKLNNGEIKVTRFDVSNINYVSDGSDSRFATITADVYIEAEVDDPGGPPVYSGNFQIVHKLKQTYQAYETELKPPVS